MEENKVQYDTILIGSGVVNIIEAAYLQSQGKKVLIIEAGDVVAGAWSTVNYESIPEVEIGCHIWDVAKGAPEFLAAIFDLNIEPLSPRPRLHTRGMRLPYDWKSNAITIKRQLKHLSRLKFSYIRKDFKQPYSRLSLWPSKYLYPRQGAFELKNGIQRFVATHKIPIQFHGQVSTLEVTDHVTVTTEKGNTYSAKEVVITSLCTIPKVIVTGQEWHNTTRHVDYIHVHMIVKNAGKKAFSYDRIMGNALVHRISDMTSQVKEQLNEGERLICAGVFHDAFHSMERDQVAKTVKKELVRMRYIASTSEIVEEGINIYPAHYTERTLLNSITERTNNKVRVLHSTNFTYSIYAQLDRWKSLLR